MLYPAVPYPSEPMAAAHRSAFAAERHAQLRAVAEERAERKRQARIAELRALLA